MLDFNITLDFPAMQIYSNGQILRSQFVARDEDLTKSIAVIIISVNSDLQASHLHSIFLFYLSSKLAYVHGWAGWLAHSDQFDTSAFSMETESELVLTK